MKKLFLFLIVTVFLVISCNCSVSVYNNHQANSSSGTAKRENNKKLMKYIKDRTVQVLWKCSLKPLPDKKLNGVKASSSRGSGSIISSSPGRSIIFTAAHVVTESNELLRPLQECKIYIKLDKSLDPEQKKIPAKLVVKHVDRDFAVISVDKDLGLQTELELNPFVGEDVWAAGYPVVLRNGKYIGLSITKGTLATLFVPFDKKMGRHHRTTAQIYFGNSGGGVWTAEGKIVGIVVFLYRYVTPYEGQYYIKPVTEVFSYMLMNNHKLRDELVKKNKYLKGM